MVTFIRLMPIESRSNSALFRRAEQLKRWEDSETNRVSAEIPQTKKSKIKFSDGCVFLAACASSDTEEVERLLEQGADINTANVDGLTALHQACIDDNLEMVQFLVEHGCNVNQGDNEGWTPLHATASCGFVSIANYLIEHGADVAAVNNDGDLPIDIAECPKMEDLLSDVLDEQGIDCDEARSEEERVMIEDANKWFNSQKYLDQVHPRTGATALHVAAAKGYTKVLNILVKAGADLNAQDNDGWTPLHAAAHWGQKEACAILADNLANMDIQNLSGQTCFDIAEPELIKLLEELKKKQASMQKERPEIQAILQRTSNRPPLKRRTSVTRMSGQEKSKSVMKDTKAERAQIEQLALPEEEVEEERDKKNEAVQRLLGLRQRVEEGSLTSRRNAEVTTSAERSSVTKEPPVERIPSWKKMLRKLSSENLAADIKSIEEPEVVTKKPKTTATDEKQSNKVPSNGPDIEVATGSTSGVMTSKTKLDHCYSKDPDEVIVTLSAPTSPSDTTSDMVSSGKRSFIPPVRDEESELQRKAHAKRVRETRRSTQGVLLEDVKSAEMQYLIKATQAALKSQTEDKNDDSNNSSSALQNDHNSLDRLSNSNSERRQDVPDKGGSILSTRKSQIVESSVHNSDSLLTNKLDSSNPDTSPSVTLSLRTKTTSNSDEPSSPDSRTAQATQAAIQRRRRPKRRSTGVVYLDSDDASEDKTQEKCKTSNSEKSQAQVADVGTTERARHRYDTTAYPDISSEASQSETSSRYSSKSSLNDENDKDYKQLYEELKKENEKLHSLQKENESLREALRKSEEELEKTKKQLKKLTEATNSKTAVNEVEKKERRALERKLSEMEEELKQMESLKLDNNRLKSDNDALLRVISKLSV